jgi:hypothetical protein
MGKAQACTQGALFFFIFPWFQCVRTMFPSSSHEVPNVFCNMFSITPHFYLVCFGKCCPPFTYIGGSKGRNPIHQNRTFNLGGGGGASIVSFFLSDGPIKLARCQKKKSKIEIGRHLF